MRRFRADAGESGRGGDGGEEKLLTEREGSWRVVAMNLRQWWLWGLAAAILGVAVAVMSGMSGVLGPRGKVVPVTRESWMERNGAPKVEGAHPVSGERPVR
jgi:hypothetical protein